MRKTSKLSKAVYKITRFGFHLFYPKYEISGIENIPQNKICNIKDPTRLNTAECIENEIANGKAKIVIHFPRWLVFSGFNIIKFLIGKNKYTYLLNKVVNPLITKE